MADFGLLGLGARGCTFRSKRFGTPFGPIGWIRCWNQEWPEGKWPQLFYESHEPQAQEEWSDPSLDHAIDAGRFTIQIDNPGPWDDETDAAFAVGDLIQALLSFVAPF